MKKRFYLSVIALLIGAMACNLPGAATPTPDSGPDAAFTFAAQTVEAELTRVALAQPTTPVPAITETASPQQPTATALLTPVLSLTPTPIPCNAVSFVQDVTIPDGTSIVTGAAFTKTWRLRNTGSCTWNTSYSLVFDRGDKMSGPDAQPLLGSVAPGATADVSVSLTAPASSGNYRGYWRLRDGAGVLFGLSTGSFWVDIKAVSPTPTPTATINVVLPPAVALANAPLVVSESGSVRSDGSVLGPRNVGDTDANVSSQAFLSFDISGIPAGVTIVDVQLDFSNYDMLGSPFGLNCLRMYPQNYGTLDSGDYFAGSPLGATARWCNAGQLSTVSVAPDIKSTIQSLVGSSRAQFRAQFNDMASNNNGVADMVRLGVNIKLIITYNP
ncbi:MAG: hypothetical protein L6461_17100 [Anaerolineae bacterium]|nr:hypothetical protein [Anaerolineae bacterium]